MIHVLAKSALALSLLGALPVTNGLAGPNTPEAAAAATAPAQEPIKFSFEGPIDNPINLRLKDMPYSYHDMQSHLTIQNTYQDNEQNCDQEFDKVGE